MLHWQRKKKQKLDRWAGHFEELLNEIVGDDINEELRPVKLEIIIDEATWREVQEILAKLENNKSTGENGVAAKTLKEGNKTNVGGEKYARI